MKEECVGRANASRKTYFLRKQDFSLRKRQTVDYTKSTDWVLRPMQAGDASDGLLGVRVLLTKSVKNIDHVVEPLFLLLQLLNIKEDILKMQVSCFCFLR